MAFGALTGARRRAGRSSRTHTSRGTTPEAKLDATLYSRASKVLLRVLPVST